MKRHWVRLQLRFEAPKCSVENAIPSGSFKWQYIAIIATLSG